MQQEPLDAIFLILSLLTEDNGADNITAADTTSLIYLLSVTLDQFNLTSNETINEFIEVTHTVYMRSTNIAESK